MKYLLSRKQHLEFCCYMKLTRMREERFLPNVNDIVRVARELARY